MSFETTCNFLAQATLYGDFDTLNSPSARMVVGRVVECGTGAFDIIYPLGENWSGPIDVDFL